ncbi:16S rRNA (guanine(966)-N(2))-methyltransferase RsmD [Bowmanella dokdonensis]
MGSIRIIAGRWRGRKLPVLDLEGLRPTTDRTRETLFNWLAPHVTDCCCLDGFAGSGGLGFEALSRHAKSVLFVEKDQRAARLIEDNVRLLGVNNEQARVLNCPLQSFLSQTTERFDLVFLDPPFFQNLLQDCVDLLDSKALLNPGALIYLETEPGLSPQLPATWSLFKQKQTGQVNYRLYQYQ